MKAIFWTSVARFDVRRLRAWIERFNPHTASTQAERIRRAVEGLAQNPALGRRVPTPDGGQEELRELIVSPYVVRYIVDPERIVIVRLWHGREDRA